MYKENTATRNGVKSAFIHQKRILQDHYPASAQANKSKIILFKIVILKYYKHILLMLSGPMPSGSSWPLLLYSV